MAKEIDLFNLYVGPTHPGAHFGSVDLGPIGVYLYEDYEDQAALIHQFEGREDTLDIVSGREPRSTTTFRPPRQGSWIETACVEITDEASQSVLLLSPISDGGLWDVCQLLTFITGRIVVTKEHLSRHRYDVATSPLCVATETLWALRTAWQNRTLLRDKKFLWAFLNYNEAICTDSLTTKGLHINAAVNVLVDHWKNTGPLIPKDLRPQLKEDFSRFIGGIKYLDEGQRNELIPQFGAKVDDGSSLVAKTTTLLKDIGVISESPTDAAIRRIKFVNRLRNTLAHQGSIPDLAGLSRNQSLEYAVNIVAGVLPEVVALVLGRALGFNIGGVGSLSQYTDDLKDFFEHGLWRGYPIETANFEAWFRSESID